MRGRLRRGDVVLCGKHSGDCFNTYILCEVLGNGVRGIPGSRFGAYTMGVPTGWQPTDREYHLLMAGEFVGGGLETHPLHMEVHGDASFAESLLDKYIPTLGALGYAES